MLKLYPFQQGDLDYWVALPRPRVLINANEMTLGKTVDGVVCSRACNYGRILVVSLASVRPEWQAEFAKWWPERERAAVIDRGFGRKNMSGPERVRLQAILENPTHICSPQLLPQLAELHATGEIPAYDAIIVDEMHRMASWRAKSFQALWSLRKRYPNADFKPLSGTPLNLDPLKAWPWLKLCEPAKWGTPGKKDAIPFQFRRLFGKAIPDDYAFSGFKYAGVNETMLPTFKERVAHLIRRHIIAEVGIQLPPMRYELKRYPMEQTATEAACDWAESAIENQTVAIFTHNIEPMDEIEAELRVRGVPSVRIWQEHSRDERVGLVTRALSAGNCVILATSGLVSTGVNYLANIKTWMLAQPSENPVEIQQLGRRFSRLSSKDHSPRVGFLLYREGEEFAAQQKLSERLGTLNSVLKPSEDAAALESSLVANSEQSFMDVLALLGRQAMAYADEEGDDDQTEAA